MSMVTLIRDEAAWQEYIDPFIDRGWLNLSQPARYPCLVGTVAEVGDWLVHRFIYPDDAALLLEAYEAAIDAVAQAEGVP